MAEVDESGEQSPFLKSSTNQPWVKDCFVAASKLTRSLDGAWIQEGATTGEDRLEQFAMRIHPDNLFEGATFTIQPGARVVCKEHHDSQNGTPSLVVCCNSQRNGMRTNSIFFIRLSCKVNMKRNDLKEALVVYFRQEFWKLPVSVWTFGCHSLESAARGIQRLYTVPSNADPLGYYTVVLLAFAMLCQHFHLNLVEQISVMVVFLLNPNSSEAFVKASFRALRELSDSERERYRLHRFGKYLYDLLLRNTAKS